MKKPFTKIIATLGPATSSKERIYELVKAGANVFRLNFSHGTLEGHKQNFDYIRQVEKELNQPIGVIADMQGPKLRVGQFKNGSVTLKEGASFRLDMDPQLGDETRVTLPHQEIFDAIEAEWDRQQNQIELIASENIVSFPLSVLSRTSLSSKISKVGIILMEKENVTTSSVGTSLEKT